MTDTTKQIEQERAPFEAWVRETNNMGDEFAEQLLTRAPETHDRYYVVVRIETAWKAWLAARATPASPAPISEQLARDAIDGAIAYGRQGINKPPSDDHWLMEYWQIGQQLAELGKTSAWDNVTPSAAPAKPQSDLHSAETIDTPKYHDLVAGAWLSDGRNYGPLTSYIMEWHSARMAAVTSRQRTIFGTIRARLTDKIEQLEAALAASVGAQVAGEPVTLSIGVSVSPHGATICVMQRLGDGSIAAIYSGTHPIGDSMGVFTPYTAPVPAPATVPVAPVGQDDKDDRIARLMATVETQGQWIWREGEPPFPQNQEWFVAVTTHGERVVLRALEEEHSYDYTTADRTYMKASKIKRWAQFPDSEYLAPVAVAPVAGEGLTAYLMREMPAGTVIGDPAWWASKIARALATQAERQPQPAAQAAVPDETLRKLAFRTLWLAYVWNDHNFDAAHLEARKTCEEVGIKSFDDANAWLAVPAAVPQGVEAQKGGAA